MSQQIRSSRREARSKKVDFNSSVNFTEANDTTDNAQKYEEQSGSNLNPTDQFYKELPKSRNKTTNPLNPEETFHEKTKRSLILKSLHPDQNKFLAKYSLMKTASKKTPILNIPKKRLRNIETDELNQCKQPIDKTNCELEEIAKKNSTTLRHSGSTHKRKTKKFILANTSTNSFKPSQVLEQELNIIPTTTQTSDRMKPSISARMADAETSTHIQDLLVPNSVLNLSNRINIIDDTVIKPPLPKNSTTVDLGRTTVEESAGHVNKEQGREFVHENLLNSSSNFHVNSMSHVPSNLPSFYISQNVTKYNTLPIGYMQHQPLVSTVAGTYAVPNADMGPSPMAQLPQQVDGIQETLKTVIERLNYIVNAQKNLQNTQNDIKIELQNLKIQNSAYENRDKWLAENEIYLPMKTKEEFTKFCDLLDQSSECRKIFEIFVRFSISSKKSITRNIASVMRKFFVCNLVNQFTAIKYVKGKSILGCTSFYQHLLKNFLEKSVNGVIHPGLTETEFKRALGEVLSNSKYSNKERIVKV